MNEFTQELLDKVVKLEDVAESVFNLKPRIARRKAALGKLPVKAFRLSGSRKGPFYILKEDLVKYVESRGTKGV